MRSFSKKRHFFPLGARYILSALLLGIQFSLLFALLYTLSAKFFWIYLFSQIGGAVSIILIVNRRGNSSYKIAWIVFILLVPVFGLAVYFLWGSDRLSLPRYRRMTQSESGYLPQLNRNGNHLEILRKRSEALARQAEFLMRESGYPLYRNTAAEYLGGGEVFFARLLQELAAAERFIFLEFFLVAEGEMWNEIHSVLLKKRHEGVEIRLLFDDFGSVKRQGKNFVQSLQKEGIKVAVFNKIRPSADLFMNNRNHRKIVVIDGRVAFTGGINLADEYINRLPRFGRWMDSGVVLTGEAAQSFTAMFCTMWEFTTRSPLDFSSFPSPLCQKSDGFLLPYCDGPLTRKSCAKGIYLQMLGTATRYVYISTPYLILDNTMISALRMAVKSGVDVRILTPHVPDKWYVHPVTQYNYRELLEAGVRIYEYSPGFVHAKLFVADDRVATVGTVNMDYRSFILHFECGVWFAECSAVLSVRDHFLELLEDSRQITLSFWKKSSLFKRILRAVLHLFSPFM